MFRADGRSKIYRRHKNRYAASDVLEHDRFGSVMEWVGIHHDGRTALVRVNGALNAHIYRDEMLQHDVVPLIDVTGGMFQHDVVPLIDVTGGMFQHDVVPLIDVTGGMFQHDVVPLIDVTGGMFQHDVVPLIDVTGGMFQHDVVPLIDVTGGMFQHDVVPLIDVNGGMFQHHVVPLIDVTGGMFQHDTARPHTARVCRNAPQRNNVHVLPRSASSADLFPTEHLWGILIRRVRQGNPRHKHCRNCSWSYNPKHTIQRI